jgi:N-methylhydantoinase B
VRASWTSQKTKIPPQGVQGGKPGAVGRWFVKTADGDEYELDRSIGTMELEYGDAVTCLMAGGGGYGDPLSRALEAVLQDVKYGVVSIQSARDDYGVVFKETDALEIDVAATKTVRSKVRAGRKE